MQIKTFSYSIIDMINQNSIFSFEIDNFIFKFIGSFVIFDLDSNIICCSEDRWLNKRGLISKNKTYDQEVIKGLNNFIESNKNDLNNIFKINNNDYIFHFNKYHLIFFKDRISDESIKIKKHFNNLMFCNSNNNIFCAFIGKRICSCDISTNLNGVFDFEKNSIELNYFFKIIENNQMVLSSYELRKKELIFENINKLNLFLQNEVILKVDYYLSTIIYLTLTNNKNIYIYKDNKFFRNDNFYTIINYETLFANITKSINKYNKH